MPSTLDASYPFARPCPAETRTESGRCAPAVVTQYLVCGKRASKTKGVLLMMRRPSFQKAIGPREHASTKPT